MPEDRSTGQTTKQILSLLLGALVVVFAATNLEAATVRLFFWQVEVSVALLVFVPLLVGFLLGWIQGRHRRDGAAPTAPGDPGLRRPPGPDVADEEREGMGPEAPGAWAPGEEDRTGRRSGGEPGPGSGGSG